MSAKIGLISDIHAEVASLREALTILGKEGVDLILCAGDIAGYGTELDQSIELLVENGCTTILGNHDVWHLDHLSDGQEKRVGEFLFNLPVTWSESIEGIRIFMVHASPPLSMNRGITLLDQHENILASEKKHWQNELKEYGFDVLVVGHTHQVFAEVLGSTLVVNPGSTQFNHTCAILGLPDLEVRIIPLPGERPRKVWHWGMMATETQ